MVANKICLKNKLDRNLKKAMTFISFFVFSACSGPRDVDNFFGTQSLGDIGNSALNITPDKYDFGPALAGGSSLVIAMTLTNTTASFPLVISSIGGITNPNFSLSTDCPVGRGTLSPKSSCRASISFHPIAGGEFQYSVVVSFSAGANSPALTAFAPMTGTGVAALNFAGVNPINPSEVTTTSVNLTWTPISQVSSYALLGGVTGSQLTLLDYASSTASSYNVQNLIPATPYTFQVKAMDLLGNLDHNSVTQGAVTDSLGSFFSPQPLLASENIYAVSPDIGLSCTDTQGHYPTFMAITAQSDPDSNCTLLISPFRISCSPHYKSGHSNWASTLSLSCLLNNYPVPYAQTMDVNVTHINRPPTLAGLGNLAIQGGVLLHSDTPNASDPNGYGLTYSCQFDTLVDGNVSSAASLCGTLLNQDGSQASLDASTGILIWTPPVSLAGTQREIQITVTNGFLSTSQIFVISIGAPPPSPSQSLVTLSQNSIASGTFTTVILQAKDSLGNSLTHGGSNVTFSTGGGGSTASFGPTVDHGNGTYSATVTGVLSGSATTLRALVQGSAVTSSLPTLTVTPGAISASTSVLTVSSPTVTSGSSIIVSLIGKDAAGNFLTTGGATILFGTSGGVSNGTFSSVTDQGNGSYVSNFVGSVSGSPTTVTGTINSVSVTTSLPQVTVGVGSVSLSQSSFTITQSALVAGSTTTLTLVLRDSGGNLIMDSSRASNLSFAVLSAGSSRGSVSTILATPGSPGTYQATFTATLAGTPNTVQATYLGLGYFDDEPSFTVSANGTSQTVSTVTTSLPSVTDDNVSQSQITVTLKDGNGNPVSGKSVGLSSNRPGSDILSAPSGLSTSSGQVTFFVRSSTQGTSTFTATDTSESLTLSQTVQVTFNPGPVSASQSTVGANPASHVTANNSDSSIITVTLLDATNNPVVGKTVNLVSSRSSSDTITVLSGSTNSLGQANFSVKSTAAGTSAFTATDVTDSSLIVNQTTNVGFIASAVSPLISTVTASPTPVSANNLATTTVTVTLQDAYQNPVSGKAVTLSTNRSGSDTISAASGTSSSLGVVTFTVHSSTIGTSIFTATDSTDGIGIQQTASVIYSLANASNSSIFVTPASIPADNSTAATVTVTLFDVNNNPVSSKAVSLSSNRGPLDSINPLNAISNSSGQAFFYLSSSKIGIPVLTATDATDFVTISRTAQVNLLAAGYPPQTDYEAWAANAGGGEGLNSPPTSTWKDVSQTSTINDGILNNFLYTSVNGWSGDGTQLTSGVVGPFRLNFDGNQDYVDFGSSMNANASFSFETWVRSASPTASGGTILTNINYLDKGVTLSQSNSNPSYLNLKLNDSEASYSQQVLADSPLIYWMLDESSGTTAADSSGHGNDGTYYSSSVAYTYSQAPLLLGSNSSVLFPGTDSNIYSNSTYYNPNTYTLEAWFKTNTTSGGGILGFCADPTSGGSCDRHIDMLNNGTLFFQNTPGGYIVSSSSYNDGNSHHVVATLSNAGAFLYVDGAQVASNASITSGYPYTGYWRVGGTYCGNGPSVPASYFLNATFDEVAIYSTALSASRIQAHYLAGKSCQSSSPLIASVWNHVAGTFSHSTGKVNLYLNGVSQCSQTYTGISVSGSTSNLLAGASTNQTNYWAGNMASLRTYPTALSSSAIQSNYAVTAARFDIQQLGASAPLMWLRADGIQGLSDGAKVSNWNDVSANGNHATQGNVANQPVWIKNGLNGYPVVRFNGTSSYLRGQSIFPTHSDYTIIAVVNFSNSSTVPVIIGSGMNPSNHAFFMANNYLELFNTNSSSAESNAISINSNLITSVIYANSNGAVSFFINKQAAGTGTLLTQNADPTIFLGTYPGFDPSNFLSGYIAELFLFGSALSVNDRALIETYLSAKYSIY